MPLRGVNPLEIAQPDHETVRRFVIVTQVRRAVSDAYRLGHITANEAGRLRHAIDRAAKRT